MNSFQIRQNKLIAFVAVEATHNTLFHFIETVKVRGQARNTATGDYSNYFKNKVEQKPLISGLVSGFFGAVVGGVAFMSTYNAMTYQLYASNSNLAPYCGDLDFRIKNLMIYFCSDLVGSTVKAPFEVRK